MNLTERRYTPVVQERSPHLEIDKLTSTAMEAAQQSALIVRKTFYGVPLGQLNVEYKSDATRKTIADVEGDVAIVRKIRETRPFDDIFIEESGYHQGVVDPSGQGEQRLMWYADSLDGTRPFVEGKPESTVGVGVFDENGNYLRAVIIHPFRKQMAVAVRGRVRFYTILMTNCNGKENPQRELR